MYLMVALWRKQNWAPRRTSIAVHIIVDEAIIEQIRISKNSRIEQVDHLNIVYMLSAMVHSDMHIKLLGSNRLYTLLTLIVYWPALQIDNG